LVSFSILGIPIQLVGYNSDCFGRTFYIRRYGGLDARAISRLRGCEANGKFWRLNGLWGGIV